MNQELNTMLRQIKSAINAYLLASEQAPVVQVRTYRKNLNYTFTTADLSVIDEKLVRFANNAVNVKATTAAVLGRKGTKTELWRLQQLLKASGRYPLRGDLKRKHAV